MSDIEKPTGDIIKSIFNFEPTGSADDTSLPAFGIKSIQDMRLPHGKDEAWRYTDIRTIFEPFQNGDERKLSDRSGDEGLWRKLVDKYTDKACLNSCVVLVDGRFSQSLSSMTDILGDVDVYSALSKDFHLSVEKTSTLASENSLKESLSTERGLFNIPDKSELSRDSYSSDILTALNMASGEEVLALRIAMGKEVLPPVQVLSLFSSESGSKLVHPRTVLLVEEGASISIKQSFVDESEGGYGSPLLVNSNTRVLVASGARVRHTYTQELGGAARHLEVLTAEVSGNASYDLSVLQLGGNVSRVNTHIDLKQINANCSLNSVALAESRQIVDMHSSILHDSEKATSRQQQRNIIADRGLVVFKGRIRIPKHAQETDSDQLCRTLMLGPRARVVAMPTLEIVADNVVCSHGASVADLDENSMFYLASRGIDRKEARKLLLRGFVLELLVDSVYDSASIARILAKVDRMNPFTENTGQSSQALLSM